MKIRARFCLPTISSPGATGKSKRNVCNTGANSCGLSAVAALMSRATICARSICCRVGTARCAVRTLQRGVPTMPLKSFIEVAPDSHFPIQNLPFGIFQPRGGKPRAGVAIGDLIADLSVLEELGHFRSPEFRGGKPFSEESLNAFLALGRPAWRKARAVLQRLLSFETPILRDNARLRARVFYAQKNVTMKLPVRIANYTDFYSSYHHAHNVGTMLRGQENALMPNW